MAVLSLEWGVLHFWVGAGLYLPLPDSVQKIHGENGDERPTPPLRGGGLGFVWRG